MATDSRYQIRNLPNALTLARIVAIVPAVIFLHLDTSLSSFISAAIYSAACFTDYLDGFFARRRASVSTVGKFLDPLADKLIVMAMTVTMLPLGRLPAWVVIVIVARELVITTLRGIASTEGLLIQSSQSGKWKTALQMIGIVGLTIHYPYRVDFLVVTTPINFHSVGFWTLMISLVFSVFSGIDYLQGFVRKITAAGSLGPNR